MAMAWIKMRTNLWDDPRVGHLADATGSNEAMIVGALYWLWATADEHTTDGLLAGLTVKAIDRKTGVPGFGEALVGVGWIEETTAGVQIVDFESHNGQSAKRRGQTARRVGKHAKANVATVSTALGKAQESVSRALGKAQGSVSTALARGRGRGREEEEKEHSARADRPPESDPEGQPAGDEFRRPGWAHDEWAKIGPAWNATERAQPWAPLTPPNGFADLAASPGWIESARAGMLALPACRQFATPVPWTQFVRHLDRILAGEFREPVQQRAPPSGGRAAYSGPPRSKL